MRPVLDCRHDLAFGGRLGAKLVGDHPPRQTALLLQEAPQQALGRLGVTLALDDPVKHISILIIGPPEPMPLARDSDHNLVQMPDVMAARRLAPEAAGVARPELKRLAADSLIGYGDAAPEQHLLDQPLGQGKPKVEPSGVGDDL